MPFNLKSSVLRWAYTVKLFVYVADEMSFDILTVTSSMLNSI